MMDDKPKRYRPRDGQPRRRALGMRTTDATRALLEAAAVASGRSLAQEVEYRLQLSFDREALLAQVREAVRWRSAVETKALYSQNPEMDAVQRWMTQGEEITTEYEGVVLREVPHLPT